ncbi:MFS transporter [Nostocaceae cyanobacterium CENA369]|uniref:MFS transporter n=2 Tax=Dendronalium TaxID=2840442 RepID=A0A8J7IE01_9NOST|nr:MFS transporter [Dendronalium phyllosphericum CENA369]
MSLDGHKKTKSVIVFISLLLAIEGLDEIVDGVMGVTYPLIRDDLELSYVQIGLLLTIPNTVSSLIEPILGILGDFGGRKLLILGGGISFAAALVLIALSHQFWSLLAALVLFYPASGAFVSLSQATLMDLEPHRHEANMARWALAGSLGNVLAPLALTGALTLNQSWRNVFLTLAALSVCLLCSVWKFPIEGVKVSTPMDMPEFSIQKGIHHVIYALKRRNVLRWLILLQSSDLMLDVVRGFLALYFVDVIGISGTQASFAFSIWLGFGLLGDLFLIPLLERVQGIQYLRLSVFLVLCLYPAFLLLPNITLKIIILGALGFLNAGWYSILQGQLYTAMLGQSGTVMALNNLAGLVSAFMPLVLGWLAHKYGLQPTMWAFLAAPMILLIGLCYERK